MSGIDTSRGINSVASTIAALEANGTQTVTTNTGAHVTGIEAAAYEFGSILAAYSPSAPTLRLNADVFRVTDANGNTTSVSLSDLARDIEQQTGFDPIVEFCAGSGVNGFSVSDINAILNHIQNQFSSMSFTPLTVVESNNALQVSGQLSSADQTALGQLGGLLNSSTPSLTQLVISTPGGLDPTAPAFLTPAGLAQVQSIQSSVSNLNSDLNNSLVTIQSGMTTIQAIQSAVSGGDPTGAPANIVTDAQNLRAAQAALSALTNNPANAALTNFAANLTTGIASAVQQSRLGASDSNTLTQLLESSGLITGARHFQGAQGTTLKSLCSVYAVSNQYNLTPNFPDQLLGDLTDLAKQVKNAFGPIFQAALAASPTGAVDASAPIFTGASGTLKSFNDVLSDLQASLPPVFLSRYNNVVNGQPFDIGRYFSSAFGGAVPNSFSASSSTAIIQAVSQPTFTDPATLLSANSGSIQSFLNINVFHTLQTGSDSSFAGLMSLCGYDANNPADVTAFNSMLDQVMPGASGKQYWSAADLNTLQLDCAKFSLSAAQSLVTQATNKLNTDAVAAINSTKGQITVAQGRVTQDGTAISSALAAAMRNTDPTLGNLQGQITTLQSQISADQANINNAQASLNALTNAYAANPRVVLTAAQQTQLASYQQTIINTASDMQQKQASIATLQDQLIIAAAPHQSLNDLLAQLHSSTGLDLSQVVQDVVGNDPITPDALNKLYTYINQNQGPGRASLQLLSTTAGGTNQGASVPSTASDSLLNYSFSDQVQNALTPVLAALNQLVPSDFDPNGNLSFTNAVFNIPSISGSPVSLSDIFAAQLLDTGIDLEAALNGLVTPAAVAGGTATINSSNLSDLIQLLNQSFPQGSLKGSSIASILQANIPPNTVTPTLTLVNNAIGALATLPVLPYDQNSANLASLTSSATQQINTWLSNNPYPTWNPNNRDQSLANRQTWQQQLFNFTQPLFLDPITGIFGKLDANYSRTSTPLNINLDHNVNDHFQQFLQSSFVQNLKTNWGLPTFSDTRTRDPNGIDNPYYACQGDNLNYTDSWYSQVISAMQRQVAGDINPNIQAATEMLGVNPFNNTPIAGSSSLAAQLGITIPANPSAADVTRIYQQIQTQVNTIAPNFVWPSSVSGITTATLTNLRGALQSASSALNAAQIAAANQVQSTVGNNGGVNAITAAQSLANLATAVLTTGVTAPESIATQNLISFNDQTLLFITPNYNNWVINLPNTFLGAGGIFSQINPSYQGPVNDATMLAFAATPFIQDLEKNWGLPDFTHFEQANINYDSTTDVRSNPAWFVGVQQAMQRKIDAIQSPNTQAVNTLLGTDLIFGVSAKGSLASQLGINVPAFPAAADASNIYQQLKTRLALAAPNFAWPASISDITPDTLSSLKQAIQNQLNVIKNENNVFGSVGATFDITEVATNLQNIQLVSLTSAVQSGQATASVAARYNQAVDAGGVPVLSSAEVNAQIEAGDLYVSSRGQFFLNRQPTNARDAAVAAFVVSGNKQNEKLNDLMNKVNLNNTKIQMATTLSAATSVADLRASIASMREQYGFADILSEITGGALTDASITNSTDISAAGSFMSSLKTAINNATKNQDLDTQSLQQLTSQIQANNTAMTQLIQAFEQMLKGLAQNLR